MTAPPPAAPRPRPSPGARPGPSPQPASLPSATKPSRAARRRAERRAGRRAWRARLIRLGQVVAVLCVAAGIATFTVLDVRHHYPARAGAGSPTPSPTPTVPGARLAQPDLASAFLAGAASDIAAVTTYDYRSLDDALVSGSAVTTGTYRKAYRAALTGALAQSAVTNHAVHTFGVLALGIGEMNASGTQAKVLVFGEERVTDDSTGAVPATSSVTLCATIVRRADQYLISELVEGSNAGLPPGGPDLRVAAEAGRAEVLSLLSYRRADFDADLQQALAGAVSPLREQIEQNAPDTKSAMTAGKYDLSGSVTAVAVERADENRVSMLMAADSSRLTDGSATPSVSKLQYEVTVTRTDSGWAASKVSPVGGG